jgi:hypothetical protein
MKNLFRDILGMDGVKDAVLLSFDGRILFEDHRRADAAAFGPNSWADLLPALDSVREADAVFQNGRIYIRRSDIGFLLVNMSPAASVAMLRLNCDILLPALSSKTAPKGLMRFFRK